MAVKEAGKTAVPKTVEATFSKQDLIHAAEVFGTTPVIMTGALYSIEKEKVTKREAKEALEAFLRKPVKKEGK